MKKKLDKKEKKIYKDKKIKLKIFSGPARPNSAKSGCPTTPKIGGSDLKPDPGKHFD
jgi:hypothetical protein